MTAYTVYMHRPTYCDDVMQDFVKLRQI